MPAQLVELTNNEQFRKDIAELNELVQSNKVHRLMVAYDNGSGYCTAWYGFSLESALGLINRFAYGINKEWDKSR